jgi:uncharacterized protein YjbJ (UPF0337 family)
VHCSAILRCRNLLHRKLASAAGAHLKTEHRMIDFPTVDGLCILQAANERGVTWISNVTCRPSADVCYLRREDMSINKDQVEGRVKEAAGKVQETAAKAVGNTTQQVKGTINKNVGAAQAKFGDMKSHVKDSQDAKDAK